MAGKDNKKKSEEKSTEIISNTDKRKNLDKKPKRVLKKASPTVRERSQQESNAKPAKRRVLNTAKKASTPFRLIGRGLAKILRPFRFLLWPFKTRPARFIGRLLVRVLLLKYIRESWQELRQVTWPGHRETFQLTFAVFIFAIVFGAAIAVTDYGLSKLFEKILLQ